jgi:hypothetical protein
MPRGTVPGAHVFAPPPGADDDEDWEPPAGRLGSALNLRELDVLGRSDSAGSFDAATQNFAMPPEWSAGTGSARPPAFSFGNGGDAAAREESVAKAWVAYLARVSSLLIAV